MSIKNGPRFGTRYGIPFNMVNKPVANEPIVKHKYLTTVSECRDRIEAIRYILESIPISAQRTIFEEEIVFLEKLISEASVKVTE
jgi:hypothetical protein